MSNSTTFLDCGASVASTAISDGNPVDSTVKPTITEQLSAHYQAQRDGGPGTLTLMQVQELEEEWDECVRGSQELRAMQAEDNPAELEVSPGA